MNESYGEIALVLVLYALLGAVFLWLGMRNTTRRRGFLLVIGGVCAAGAVLILMGMLLPWERGIVLGLLFPMSGILFGLGLFSLVQRRHCTSSVEAVCVGSERRGNARGGYFYAPVFTYEFGGKKIRAASLTHYRRRRFDRLCVKGQAYTVHVDPAKPDVCADKRKAPVGDAVMIFFGVLFLALTVISLFADVGIR